jgi:hypothetical protein
MKLFLPTIGSRLVLSKPWTFKLKDDGSNEKWWTAVHGAPPAHQSYWYGYDPTGKKITSPVETPDCYREAHTQAAPIPTTLPRGTTLMVEQVYIRKGLREFDSLILKVPKGDASGVPTGKFNVPLREINGKLEAVADLPTKYPNGKFTITTAKGQEYLNCSCHKYPCICPRNPPDFIKEYLVWQSMGEGSRYGGIVAYVEHYRNTAGKDEITERDWPISRYYRAGVYTKAFDKIEDLLGKAQAMGFTDAHIQAFVDAYQLKKDQWEAEKALMV